VGRRLEKVDMLHGHLEYFVDIWDIYDHLVYFVFIWYIFPVLLSWTNKNLANLLQRPFQSLGNLWGGSSFGKRAQDFFAFYLHNVFQG
jgi:hypothetical protein